jgi:putative ABC transport system permease protein
VVFGEFDWTRVSPGSLGGIVYVDLPAGTTVEQTAVSLAALQRFGSFEAGDVPPEWFSYGDSGDRVSTSAMAWGWVAGALALCVVGIIIAAAFATSARRQLVTLGQLSANGADQKLLRRTMALQGSWSGLFGSLGGVALALVLLVAFRGVVDQLAGKHLGAYEIMPIDLVIIVLTGVAAATIAALVPARSIAKVPVMAALSGRRPLGAVPRRLVPIGLGLFGAGLFLLMLAATATTGNDGGGSGDGDLYAAVAVLGGLGVLFGMCCLSPLAVDTVGKVGARLSGSWRLSARSLARTRTRSAGVVTAIAAAGALALGGATAFASAMADEPIDSGVPTLPADTVLVAASTWNYDDGPTFGEGSGSTTYDPPGYQVAPIPTSILDQVGAVVDGDVSPRRVALWDPAPYEMTPEGTRIDGLQADESGILMVADPFVLDLIGLSDADRARLDEAGAMNVWSYGSVTFPDGSLGVLGEESNVEPSTVVIDVEGQSPVTVDVIAPLDPIDSLAGVWGTMVTPERAAELGLEIVEDGIFIVADTDLTTDQIERLEDIQNSVWNGSVFDVFDADQLAGQTQVSITPNYVEDEVPEDLVNLAIVVAALLFTLSIVGIGLALSAAESRDERDVLVAIGAKPSTMRRVAGQKAVLMSLAGTLLAVPTGLLPVVTVVRAVRQYPGEYPLAMPWGMVFVLVVGVPVLAGLVTWLGSAAAQRLRPTHMSTLATD